MSGRGKVLTPDQVAEFVALMLVRWCPHQVGQDIDAIESDGRYVVRRLLTLEARKRKPSGGRGRKG